MTIRSYLASLSFFAVVVASAASVQAEAVSTSVPLGGPPAAYPYQEGMFLPPGYHVEQRSRKGLVWSGVAVFSTFYVFALAGAAGKDPASPYYLVPFAGPLIFASRRECPSPCDDLATTPMVFVLTAGQATGALLFAMGFASPRTWIVPDSAPSGAPRVAIVPSVDGSNQGLAVVGTF